MTWWNPTKEKAAELQNYVAGVAYFAEHKTTVPDVEVVDAPQAKKKRLFVRTLRPTLPILGDTGGGHLTFIHTEEITKSWL